MKICLISLPLLQSEEYNFFPLGIHLLATVLKKAGHQVKIFDLQLARLNGKLRLNKNLFKSAAQLVRPERFDLVGISAMCSNYPHAILMAKECKRTAPRTKIVLGGPQPTVSDLPSLKAFLFIDLIVRGEGEQTFLELAEKLDGKASLAKVAGLTWRDSKGVIQRNQERELIKDLDQLPMLDYSIKPGLEEYTRFMGLQKFLLIEAGRGCPFNCYYCSTSLFWKRRFRFKSPERIVREMKELSRLFGVNFFCLNHDNLTINKKMVLKLCRLLIRENDPNLTWFCHTRADFLDRELIQAMKKSGCKVIFLGIETGSPRMQKIIGKNLDLKNFVKVIKECWAHGLDTRASFMLGFPEETRQDINDTLEMILKLLLLNPEQTVLLNPLAPLSGTSLFQQYHKRLVLNHDYWKNSFMRTSESEGLPAVKQQEIMVHQRLLSPLLKKHPDIFCSFYYIRPLHLSFRLLRRIKLHYINMIQANGPEFDRQKRKEGLSALELFEKLMKSPQKARPHI